jgi:N-acetyl-anhydromuramyl-L-alanine amidase AmpD
VPAPAPPAIAPVWVGSPNHYSGDLHDVVALVVHTMVGSLNATDGWFQRPASQVSSHYGTGLDGRLHQYVDIRRDGSWANGVLEAGNKWSPRFGHENPNHRSITVETEDNRDPARVAVSQGEYEATLAAGQLAIAQWPSIEVVTSHHVISPRSKPICAGDRWVASGRLRQLAAELGRELLV